MQQDGFLDWGGGGGVQKGVSLGSDNEMALVDSGPEPTKTTGPEHSAVRWGKQGTNQEMESGLQERRP